MGSVNEMSPDSIEEILRKAFSRRFQQLQTELWQDVEEIALKPLHACHEELQHLRSKSSDGDTLEFSMPRMTSEIPSGDEADDLEQPSKGIEPAPGQALRGSASLQPKQELKDMVIEDDVLIANKEAEEYQRQISSASQLEHMANQVEEVSEHALVAQAKLIGAAKAVIGINRLKAAFDVTAPRTSRRVSQMANAKYHAPLQAGWMVAGEDEGDDNEGDSGSLAPSMSHLPFATEEPAPDSSKYDFLTIKPTTWGCLCWDFWTTYVITYDLVMTPMEVFEFEISTFSQVMELTSTMTWVIDMLLSFVRGYPAFNGTIERRLKLIVRRYLRSWFAFDISVIVLDLALALLQTSASNYLAVFRTFRLLRLLRIARVMKMKARLDILAQTLQFTQSRNVSDSGAVILNMFKNCSVIVMANHFIACIWYAIGTLDSNTLRQGWVQRHQDDFTNHNDNLFSDALYLYLTSYHWALTQYTPASMEVVPASSAERGFCVLVIVLGLMTFCSFIGGVTQGMTRLQNILAEEEKAFRSMRRYLSEKRLSMGLANTVATFIRENKDPVALPPVKFEDVALFKFLPNVLTSKIQIEAMMTIAGEHPIFQYLHESNPVMLSSLCKECCYEISLRKGEVLFSNHQPGTAMYFCLFGKLSYSYDFQDKGLDADFEELFLSTPHVTMESPPIGEMCLWLDWTHCGRLSGCSQGSDLLVVTPGKFKQTLEDAAILKQVRLYARLYALRFLKAATNGHVDDLWAPDDEIEEIGRLALFGGLDTSLKALGRNSYSPEAVFKAWSQLIEQKKWTTKVTNALTWLPLRISECMRRSERRKTLRKSNKRSISESRAARAQSQFNAL